MTFELDSIVFRPDRPGVRKVLGDLEAQGMELIWQRPLISPAPLRRSGWTPLKGHSEAWPSRSVTRWSRRNDQ
jgi:hypothetical protein